MLSGYRKKSDQAHNLHLFSFPVAHDTRGTRSSIPVLTNEKFPRFRDFARGSALFHCLIFLASPVSAQSTPVLVDGGYSEVVLNDAAQVNVSVVDGEGFGPNDHGSRITNTFLANTEEARLVQLNGWAHYQYDGALIQGINTTGLVYHSLNIGSGILWSASDESPFYRTDTASWWDDSGDRPFHKDPIAAADWFAMHDILFIASLENYADVSSIDPRAVYCDDYPHIHRTDYWVPLCGAMEDYIAHSGIGSERTIFVGGIYPWGVANSAVRAGGVFEQHAIYVESLYGSTSHATPVIAAYATNLAAANPTWGAVRLKQEMMALATDETLMHRDGETRMVKVIRPMPTSIEVEIPATLALSQNYPNPFNPSTTITYTLDRPGPVEMSVYDLTGRIVSILVNGMQPAGQYEVRFDADGLPPGMYLYHLRADGQSFTRAMTLVR